MELLKFLLRACLAASVCSAAVVRNEPVSPLIVTLSQSGNDIIASLTNSGSIALKLFTFETILDPRDVEKLSVFTSDTKVPFHEMAMESTFDPLLEAAFVVLGPSESKDVVVNLAEAYDLSEGGIFEINASGSFKLADLTSTSLNGNSVSYNSNTLTVEMNHERAIQIRDDHLSRGKRAIIFDCGENETRQIRYALGLCGLMAAQAAQAALDDSQLAKFEEYFRSANQVNRIGVSMRLLAIAKHCAQGEDFQGGLPRIHCANHAPEVPAGRPEQGQSHSHEFLACKSPGGLGQTYPVNGQQGVLNGTDIALCQPWVDMREFVGADCHDVSKASTLISLMARSEWVYKPGIMGETYGYDEIVKLDHVAAFKNPFTYSLYAQAVYKKC